MTMHELRLDLMELSGDEIIRKVKALMNDS